MKLPFNATCGDVASWRNDQTDWKQAFAKFLIFQVWIISGGTKKLRALTPNTPRGYGPVVSAYCCNSDVVETVTFETKTC